MNEFETHIMHITITYGWSLNFCWVDEHFHALGVDAKTGRMVEGVSKSLMCLAVREVFEKIREIDKNEQN